MTRGALRKKNFMQKNFGLIFLLCRFEPRDFKSLAICDLEHLDIKESVLPILTLTMLKGSSNRGRLLEMRQDKGQGNSYDLGSAISHH